MWDKIKSMRRDPAAWFGLLLVALLIVALGWIGASANRRTRNCAEYEEKAGAAYASGNYADAELYYQKFLFGEDECSPGDNYDEYLSRRDEASDYNWLVGDPVGADYRLKAKGLLEYLSDSRNDKFRPQAEASLAQLYDLWSEDTTEGADLMREIYEVVCEDAESEVLQTTDLADPESEPRYWYPESFYQQSESADSPYMAQGASEFRVAVCAEAVETTIIETCTYSSGGNALSAGPFGSAVRKSARYKLTLKDTATGDVLAEYEPVMSLPAGGCPLSMTPYGFDEIVGEPDYDSARDWIEEQTLALR